MHSTECSESHFERCNFQSLAVRESTFRRSRFELCNWGRDEVHRGVSFFDCKIVGKLNYIIFQSQSYNSYEGTVRNLDLSECELNQSQFIGYDESEFTLPVSSRHIRISQPEKVLPKVISACNENLENLEFMSYLRWMLSHFEMLDVIPGRKTWMLVDTNGIKDDKAKIIELIKRDTNLAS